MLLPQPLATVATAAAATAVVVLSGASVANVYETYALVRQRRAHLQLPNAASSPPQSVLHAQRWASVDEAVEGLSDMTKKELMELFLHCDAPELSDLAYCDGKEELRMVYDGTLLGNGPILTLVTNFITNRLFGRGRPWLGKAYMSSGGLGKNRFAMRHSKSTAGESLDRTFNYSMGPSSLPSIASTSLFNRYAPHCQKLTPMSLFWGGMVDELRVVKLKNGSNRSRGKELLLLGMGYFSWSLGCWNSAPFCLVVRKAPWGVDVDDTERRQQRQMTPRDLRSAQN
ncbi:hypothetical protein ACHAXT_012446 [Thalassiosira profunda]